MTGLAGEQLKLRRFRPWVQHSFEAKAKPIVFHAQMLGDFNTMEELARKMLDGLAENLGMPRMSAEAGELEIGRFCLSERSLRTAFH
jgi:hypothetical protein